MWVAHNNTPFAIERGFIRDRQGGEVWLLVIKGTFDISADGSLRRAAEQPSPARAAAWSGEPGRSSLLHDADFILGKNATDVLVHGHAYAPAGRPAPSVDVTLKIGSLVKRLRAHGVRAWMRSPTSRAIVPGPAQPFDRVAITYEQAFGGSDPLAPPARPTGCAHNPVGVGFCYRPDTLIGQPAPRITYVDAPLQAGAMDVAPAGLGPIAPAWAPRARLAGTYDEAWEARRAPLPPDDFDDRFYRTAPADQQLHGFLSAGQTVELFNLTPHGYLRARVPDLTFKMRAIFTDGEERTHAVLHTMLLHPDQARVQLVWHTSLACHAREHKLTRAIVDVEGDRTCLSP